MDADRLNSVEGPTAKARLVADLGRTAARDRWGLALAAVGWVHLAVFLTCQVMHARGDRVNWHYVGLWGLELFAALAVIRLTMGRGWHRTSSTAGMLARVWMTFLILSFNVASLNTLTGLDHEWFQPVLATLSSFAFATTAYLLTPRFFIPAVQMYVTGLLMALNPEYHYVIYGFSWWITLQGIGVVLEGRRIREASAKARASLGEVGLLPGRVDRPAGLFGVRLATRGER